MQMQDLLDEWLISVWQNREHDGLRDPLHPQRAFSPNQKYATLIETAGYVPVPLSAGDYIELLPAAWRAVNAYGIKISHRTYDAEELNPIRQQKSGVAARKGQWEVHHDPYDVSGCSSAGRTAGSPARGSTWRKSRPRSGNWPGTTSPASSPSRDIADPSELERALAVEDLLRRAYHGPPDGTGPDTAGPARNPAGRPEADGQGPAGRRPHARRHGSPGGDLVTPAEQPVSATAGNDPETAGAGRRRAGRQGDPAGNLRPHEEAKKPGEHTRRPRSAPLAAPTMNPGTGS